MNTISKHLYPIVALTVSMSGCKVLDKYQNIFPTKELETKITQQETVYIYCNEGNIQDYVDKGWRIVDTEIEEVPCTWKTKKATKRCDPDLDKGCRITVPDKYGKEIIYSLERNNSSENK